MAAYHVLAQYVDTCVGRIIDTLTATNQLEETLFLFTTDHGIPFPTMKCNLSEGGTGISLIARFPDEADLQRGTIVDELVSQIDLFPTFCDFLGLPVPDWVEGESILPLLHGTVDSIRNEVFSEVTYHAAYEPKRSIRTERYRYVRRFDENYDQHVAPNTDNGPTKQFFLDLGFFEQQPPTEALYDLFHDPTERNNLVDDSRYEDVYEDLRNRLRNWMERTNDPLLEGAVSKPDGAVVDKQDVLHPYTEPFEAPNVR
ncbi:hypothetical protein A4G99_19275 [Haladaptatus sp. R4]|nr:hypothetical protein A4G99_19275 [Haladaptatus sp. R4]